MSKRRKPAAKVELTPDELRAAHCEEARRKDPRKALLSELAAWVGGFNAGPPGSLGRLSTCCPDYMDDGKVVSYLLDLHAKQVRHPLDQEITKLKARLYDLEHKA